MLYEYINRFQMFFAPLSDPNNPHSKLITQNDFEKLFRNLNEVYSINTEFLKDLKQASEFQQPNINPNNKPRQTIGQVFLMYSEYFKCYGLYCAGHNAALATLKKLEVWNIHNNTHIGVEEQAIYPILPFCLGGLLSYSSDM